MSDLIDRLSGEAESRPKINVHRFMAAERLYALGELSASEIVTDLDLQGDEITQATTLKDRIDGELKVADKALYVLRVESVCMCIEDHDDTLYHNPDGTVDKTRVVEDLLF